MTRFNARLAGRVYFLVILYDLFMIYWSPFDPIGIGRGGAFLNAVYVLVIDVPNWAGVAVDFSSGSFHWLGNNYAVDFIIRYMASATSWAIIAGFIFQSKVPGAASVNGREKELARRV